MNYVEIAGLLTSLGSLIGAFVLWRKSRPEANKIRAEESKTRTESFNTEVDAIRTAYSSMLKDQIENIVNPMERRIDRLNKLVSELQTEVDELKNYRNLFDVSILYIRSLCHWIDTIENISKANKPKLPIELRDYFNLQNDKKKGTL